MDYKIEDYKAIAEEMVSKDHDRDAFFEKSDLHTHGDWEKPVEWANISWIRPFKTSDASNAMDASVRTLATKHPQLTITPTRSDKDNRLRFDQIERGLDWMYRQSERRRDSNPTRSIVESCLRYDEYAGQVIYLPHQIEAMKTIKGVRAKRAANFGPFMTVIHNPRSVHTLYSDYMLEKVLHVRRMKAHEVVSFWGDLAKDLKDAVASSDSERQLVTEDCDVYDYWDDEKRVVWVCLGGGGSGSDFTILAPESDLSNNTLGFIPWIHGVGGSSLESREDLKRKPLLNNIIRSGSWHNQMLFGSLMFSLAMQRAAMPVLKTETPTGEGVDIDVTDPVGQLALRTGENAINLPPAGIDPVVKEMFDRLSTFIGASSGTRVLQTLDYPQGSAFATVNAIIQAAVSVLDPFKQLAEQGIGDALRLQVAWLKYKKAPLKFYNDTQKSPTYGAEDDIPWDMLPEQEDLYLNVNLKPSVPTDEMQRINGATMMVRELKFPNARALETLDVQDPEAAIEEWRQEQEDMAALEAKKSNIMFETQMQQQQMMAQAQAAAQQGAQPSTAPGAGISQGPYSNAAGQGFNDAAGGTPPSVAAPDVNREQISGSSGQTPGIEARGLGMGSSQNISGMMGG